MDKQGAEPGSRTSKIPHPGKPQTEKAHFEKPEINKNPPPTLHDVSARQYLDQTVAPTLLRGLLALVKERPQDPVFFLAGFMLSNAKNKVRTEPRWFE